MGRCYPDFELSDDDRQAAADQVAELPPLTPEQLDALCDTLASIRLRTGAQ